jgi:dihydrofolate reductase
MKLIVAVCEDWGIGLDGDQPFYIPEDLRRFKEMTMGKAVVMGRVTLSALPNGPLKGRTNMVLTRDESFTADGVTVCNSLEELAQCLSRHDRDDVFVIGGQQVYELLLDYCEAAHITKIFATVPTDRSFPNLDMRDNWRLHSRSEMMEYEGIQFCYCEYRNDRPKEFK